MKRVFITDGVHPLLIEGFQTAGFETTYDPSVKLNDVKNQIDQFDGIIINSKIIMDQPMLDAARRLQFIGRLGSGLEIIDLEYARKKNIAVYNSPEGNRNAVAEHALGMLLSLANKLNQADAEVRNFKWNREANRGFEIIGKTLGIIGFGHTGSTFAKKMEGLGVKVLAHDKYKKHFANTFRYVEEVPLNYLIQNSDIVSFHLPLTDDTSHFFDKKFLEHSKDGLVVINTSRGKVVNTKDLIDALLSGKVSGACLDVFENEKPHLFNEEEKIMYDKLYGFENVVLSPHVAGWTYESKEKLAQILLDKILNKKGAVN